MVCLVKHPSKQAYLEVYFTDKHNLGLVEDNHEDPRPTENERRDSNKTIGHQQVGKEGQRHHNILPHNCSKNLKDDAFMLMGNVEHDYLFPAPNRNSWSLKQSLSEERTKETSQISFLVFMLSLAKTRAFLVTALPKTNPKWARLNCID